MAGRPRRGHEDPLPVRAARDRERHLAQVTSYGYFAGRGPKRSATVNPAPLRYWQYNPPRAFVAVLVVLVVAAWLVVLGRRDGSAAAWHEAPFAIVLGLVVLLF